MDFSLNLREREETKTKQIFRTLVAIPLSVFINRMDTREHVGIAVTGSLYRYHPQLKNLLETHIRKIVPNRSFNTFLSDDGSGKGAGLVAAVAARLSH